MTSLIAPYDPAWPTDFEREASAIRAALSDVAIVLHHIGSTAIPGILAKPIIDMLGVADDIDSVGQKSTAMKDLGYEPKGSFGIEGRLYFRKFDGEGRRTHHFHVFAKGSAHVERHLAFCDYLRSTPLKAAEYSDLKARIATGSSITWDEYMDAKDTFIAETERLAVEWYRKQHLNIGCK